MVKKAEITLGNKSAVVKQDITSEFYTSKCEQTLNLIFGTANY